MERFRGHNELTGAMNAVLWAAATTVVFVLAITGGGWPMLALWMCGVVGTPFVYFGARYRVTVGPEGVQLRTFYLWPLLWRTDTHYLDVEVDRYDAWDSDRSEGIYLRSAKIGEDDTEPFGPYWDEDAMDRLRFRIAAAIDRQRRAITTPRELRFVGMRPEWFDVLERSPSGVPRTLRSRVATTVLGVDVPAGSVFHFNRPGWVDPARSDELDSVTLANGTRIRERIEVEAGVRLIFSSIHPSRVTLRGGSGELVLGELTVGRDLLTFDTDLDAPVAYTLRRPVSRGGVMLPCETEVRPAILLDHGWAASLGGGVERPGWPSLSSGDTIYFDASWRPVYLSLRRRVAELDGHVLEGDLSVLSLTKSGDLDIASCKDRGLTAG